jgi:peptidoglycan/xylan/chitin deacetylase (PgdA/CDA1 family)
VIPTVGPTSTSRSRLLTAVLMTVPLIMACQPAAPTDSQTHSPAPAAIDQGIASISFDDGTIGQYTHARPVLRANEMPATFYLVSDALGWGSITIDSEQARELLEEGHEIGNHTRTHKDLADLTPAQVSDEFAGAQDAFESQVGVRPTTCAYPYGSSNAAVTAEAQKQFEGCRSTRGGLNQRGRLVTYDLFSHYVLTTTTAAEIRAAAERARHSKSWIIFVYHDVDPSPQEQDDVTPELFAEHIDAIVSTGIAVETVESALAGMRE